MPVGARGPEILPCACNGAPQICACAFIRYKGRVPVQLTIAQQVFVERGGRYLDAQRTARVSFRRFFFSFFSQVPPIPCSL